ncbi:MAG: glycosyltransferase family 2 protein, partial [Endomicrobiia bacterium]
GLGKALKTGFEYILSNCSPQDIIITLDADNTHPIETSKKMVEKIQAGADIVIASRYCPGAGELGLGLIRKTLSKIASFVFSIFFAYPEVKDYTSGYRAYCARILLKMKNFYSENFITEIGFPAGTEILLKSFIFKPKIQENSLVLRYDLKRGKSKIKLLSTIFSYLKLILKLKFL